ncbi:MAG TPA: hypothetical protein VM933_11230, partial [Acidimicrobiales bacterium]|nr:hypothetical protein [Acidimicrobiales bacterium]
PFSGYATGTALHVNALQVAGVGPLIENTALAFSGASVASQGQAAAITNEMGLGVQPAKAERESYGRGSGLEAGVARTLPNNPDTNQVILGALAEAGATPLEPAAGAPNSVQTALQTKELTKQNAGAAVYASVLRGQAQAMWNERSALAMLGNPLGFGLGYADDVQLLNVGGPIDPEGRLTGPLVATDTTATSGERTTSQTLSATYLVNNGDGTCGLASETRITLAPVRLNLPPDANPANDVTIEVLGEFILRAVATGQRAGTITFAPAAGGPNEPIVRIIQGSAVTNVLTTQQLFGDAGLILPPDALGALTPAFSIAVGEDPRAINPAPTSNPDAKSAPVTTITEASAAVDILRIRLIQPTPTVPGLNALDLRLGHFETRAVVPEGGLNCEIPVTKTVDKPQALAGEQVTFTITIPSSADILIPFPCDLSSIRVVDTHSVKSGNPRFRVVSGTGPTGQAGVVEGDVITFPDIGSYTPGQPPLEVKVVVELLTNSEAGELQDTADVTAVPANCKAQANAVGRAFGGDAGLAGLAGLTGTGLAGGGGSGLTGEGTLSGPGVTPVRELPRTGGLGLVALGGGALVTFLATRMIGRRRQASAS